MHLIAEIHNTDSDIMGSFCSRKWSYSWIITVCCDPYEAAIIKTPFYKLYSVSAQTVSAIVPYTYVINEKMSVDQLIGL